MFQDGSCQDVGRSSAKAEAFTANHLKVTWRIFYGMTMRCCRMIFML
jgi:hypothetical protein